jgi:flagellar basal-body rod modification protein FlgD
MDPTQILPTADSSSSVPQASGGTETLGQDSFLNLLTVQLQNQDPSNPVSNEDFIAQLAQFSSLEQLVGIQEKLELVYLGVASMNNATMATLLGSEVVASGDRIHVAGEGDVTLHFDAGAPAQSGTVTIEDADGKVVATLELGAVEEGEGSIVWDGTDLDGNPVGEGDYTVRYEATGADGESIDVTPLVVGLVDSVDYSTGVPRPSVGGVDVGIDAIIRVATGS